MKSLSDILEKVRKARETGKNPGDVLPDRDLAVAKAEAKELWDALNSGDVTGNIKKTVNGNAAMLRLTPLTDRGARLAFDAWRALVCGTDWKRKVRDERGQSRGRSAPSAGNDS